jgi:iron only hydrogenase large subunit-like protein
MKFEARRDGMMRKGISDVDSVLTVRELARLIRLYGIDATNVDPQPADEPLAERSSAASLAEVSGGLAESVVRSLSVRLTGSDAGKLLFKKIRSSASFRDSVFQIGDKELNVAVVDGLTGLEKLRSALASGKKYNLVEVMTCPGGCVNGAGMPFTSNSKEDRKNRVKVIYQADETDAVCLPCKSPVIIKLYEKILKENKETTDRKIFHTHFEKRNVLL